MYLEKAKKLNYEVIETQTMFYLNKQIWQKKKSRFFLCNDRFEIYCYMCKAETHLVMMSILFMDKKGKEINQDRRKAK